MWSILYLKKDHICYNTVWRKKKKIKRSIVLQVCVTLKESRKVLKINESLFILMKNWLRYV